MPVKKNLVGLTFGLLTVIKEIKNLSRVSWLCQCICGRTTVTQTWKSNE